jgi:rhodanese-related sulfurtransferase
MAWCKTAAQPTAAPHRLFYGQGAINIPASTLTQRVDELRGKTIVLYCQSGLRSQEALQLILRQGRDQVYSLGAMARWEST